MLSRSCVLRLGRRAVLSNGARALGTSKPRKPGVLTDEELADWMAANPRETIVVVDARNTDFSVEPGDEVSLNIWAKKKMQGSLSFPYPPTPFTCRPGEIFSSPKTQHCRASWG